MSKKNAVLMAVSDDHCFAAFCTILSIKDNSPNVYNKCEFIILHNGICPQNMDAILMIRDDIRFIRSDLRMAKNIELMFENPTPKHLWRLEKLSVFGLLKEYKRILCIDCDIYVNRPLDYIFDADFDCAFIHVDRSDGPLVYPHLINNLDDEALGPEGAFIVFDESVNRFNITTEVLKELSHNLKILRKNPDEIIYSYLMYHFGMKCLQLPIKANTSLGIRDMGRCTLQHFARTEKPWIKDYVFRLFPRWGAAFHKFRYCGGVNYPPIIEDKNSFYNYTFTIRVLHTYQDMAKNYPGILMNHRKIFKSYVKYRKIRKLFRHPYLYFRDMIFKKKKK